MSELEAIELASLALPLEPNDLGEPRIGSRARHTVTGKAMCSGCPHWDCEAKQEPCASCTGRIK